MPGGGIEVTAHSSDLDNLIRALRREADGKELAKELRKNMRDALKPAADLARNSILAMQSSGRSNSRPALRQAIAKRIRPEVKTSGRGAGVRVKARKLNTNVRGFVNAPKRTQQPSWRVRVYGTDTWVEQQGKLNWFDDAMHERPEEYKQAVVEAMEDMARRIVNRI